MDSRNTPSTTLQNGRLALTIIHATRSITAALISAVILVACAATQPPEISSGHLRADTQTLPQHIPAPVARTAFVPVPSPTVSQETYTVVVNEVPIKELLFALARDAKINVDIHPSIKGSVTLNAVNQTLLQILARLSEQVPLVYVFQNGNLAISPDIAVLRSYKVDYVNLRRSSSSTVSVATKIATAGGSVGGAQNTELGNSSSTTVTSENNNEFWTTLVANVQALLQDSAPSSTSSSTPTATASTPSSSSSTASSSGGGGGSGGGSSGSTTAAASNTTASSSAGTNVIANALAGVLTVRATERQHRQIQHFLDQIMAGSTRQVLIEATIVEVELNDRYQGGIDWSLVQTKGANSIAAASSLLGNELSTPPAFIVNFDRMAGKDLTASLRLLETFGDTKVLSSPKIIALNNQTALLKVVDEKVYFQVDVKIELDQETNQERRSYKSDIHTVPVGIIMSVTPQINDNGNITLNIRPTVTRITGFAIDPVPRLLAGATQQNFDNLVPEIQIREMESLLQVRTGQTVMLGGLMQDTKDKNSNGVPFLSRLPLIGGLFNRRDDTFSKSELVIFLRPLVANSGNPPDVGSLNNLLPPKPPSLSPQSAVTVNRRIAQGVEP